MAFVGRLLRCVHSLNCAVLAADIYFATVVVFAVAGVAFIYGLKNASIFCVSGGVVVSFFHGIFLARAVAYPCAIVAVASARY